MNRREFIQAALAAAVVAHIPLTEAEAVEAYDASGIQDHGNGWYRCWMTYTEKGVTLQFSTFARAGDQSQMQLSHGKIRAWFDLETGEVGRIEVVNDHSKPSITVDGELWRAQIETIPDECWT